MSGRHNEIEGKIVLWHLKKKKLGLKLMFDFRSLLWFIYIMKMNMCWFLKCYFVIYAYYMRKDR